MVDAGRKRRCRAAFTLIELVVAMAIFSILMMILINIFTSAQKAWSTASARNEMTENARIAMDIMSRDIQSIYYENGKIPFWHKEKSADAGAAGGIEYINELLAFVSATSTPQTNGDDSRLFEVCYQLYYAEDFTTGANPANAGWLQRSVTGDGGSVPNLKWNFYRDNDWTAPSVVAQSSAAATFTTNDDSRNAFQKLIPYVTALEFTCLKQIKDGLGNPVLDVITPTDTSIHTEFPYAIMIKLTVMNGIAWEKWQAMGGKPHLVGESSRAEEFRKENERTFTKTVLIGDRGQY
jgi:type II secretion system protein J